MGRKYEIAVLSRGSYARTVRIYAPKKADRAVIMHDGQNVFYDSEASFKKSWRALDAIKSLNIKNTAVIGIDSMPATRNDDYLPFPNELAEYGMEPFGGKADAYMEYLEQTVLPYLDRRFGFKKYAMLGSSFGAVATLYFASRRNDRFCAYGLFSTPLFVSNASFERFLDSASFDTSAAFRIYTGGDEGSAHTGHSELAADMFVNDSFKLVNALRKKGVKKIDLTVNNTGIHDETCWREPEREFFKDFSK